MILQPTYFLIMMRICVCTANYAASEKRKITNSSKEMDYVVNIAANIQLILLLTNSHRYNLYSNMHSCETLFPLRLKSIVS